MARSFNGTTDQIDCGANVIPPGWGVNAASGLGGITISAWVNVISLPSTYAAIYSRVNPGNSFHQLFCRSTGHFAYYLAATGGSTSVDPGSFTISTGIWNHVAMVYYTSIGLSTFVNGISDGASGNNGALTTVFALSHTSLGTDLNTAGRNVNAAISDAAMWLCALSPQEIYALAKGVLRPYQIQPSCLAIWCPLDGYGAPALDRSGFGNNGVLTGTAFTPGPPLLSPLPPLFAPKNTSLKTPTAAAFLAAWALQRNIAIEGVAT